MVNDLFHLAGVRSSHLQASQKNFDWSQSTKAKRSTTKVNLSLASIRMGKSTSFCGSPSTSAPATLATKSSSSNDIIKEMMNDLKSRRRSKTSNNANTNTSSTTTMKQRLQQMNHKILVPVSIACKRSRQKEDDKKVALQAMKLNAQMHVTMAKMFTKMDKIGCALEEYNKAATVWLIVYQNLAYTDDNEAEEAMLSAVSTYGIMVELYTDIGDHIQAQKLEQKCNDLLECNIEIDSIHSENAMDWRIFSIGDKLYKDDSEVAAMHYQSMANKCRQMGKYFEAQIYHAKAQEHAVQLKPQPPTSMAA